MKYCMQIFSMPETRPFVGGAGGAGSRDLNGFWREIFFSDTLVPCGGSSPSRQVKSISRNSDRKLASVDRLGSSNTSTVRTMVDAQSFFHFILIT